MASRRRNRRGKVQCDADHQSKKDKICKHIQKICKERNGKVIDCYQSCTQKMTFECEKGHRWQTRYSVIKSGSWCPRCINRKTRKNDFIDEVSSLGGKMIGDYIRIDIPLAVECKNGHRFDVRPSRVFYKGLWCDKCEGRKERKRPCKYERPRRPYKKGPRCTYTIKFGKNEGCGCKRKSFEDGLCRYHIQFKETSIDADPQSTRRS